MSQDKSAERGAHGEKSLARWDHNMHEMDTFREGEVEPLQAWKEQTGNQSGGQRSEYLGDGVKKSPEKEIQDITKQKIEERISKSKHQSRGPIAH